MCLCSGMTMARYETIRYNTIQYNTNNKQNNKEAETALRLFVGKNFIFKMYVFTKLFSSQFHQGHLLWRFGCRKVQQSVVTSQVTQVKSSHTRSGRLDRSIFDILFCLSTVSQITSFTAQRNKH
jgi:hypothetical protein